MLLWMVLVGCAEDPDNFLRGSMTTTYGLEFNDVRSRLYDSELSIEYLYSDDETPETVTLRVTLDNAQLASNTVYDLLSMGNVGRSDVYGGALPDMNEGELTLELFEETDGSDISGRFQARFVTPDETQLALRGAFLTTLERVEL
ncbi:MAG: hypothetical protein AAFV53_03745 [Myxococcota bacterium]